MAGESAFDRLAALIGLNIDPVPRRNWAAVEASLGGLSLPGDYKRLADNLPKGRFKDLIGLVLPGNTGHPENDYLGQYRHALDDLRESREDGDGDFPYPLFPDEGGLLPWGDTFRGQ